MQIGAYYPRDRRLAKSAKPGEMAEAKAIEAADGRSTEQKMGEIGSNAERGSKCHRRRVSGTWQ